MARAHPQVGVQSRHKQAVGSQFANVIKHDYEMASLLLSKYALQPTSYEYEYGLNPYEYGLDPYEYGLVLCEYGLVLCEYGLY